MKFYLKEGRYYIKSDTADIRGFYEQGDVIDAGDVDFNETYNDRYQKKFQRVADNVRADKPRTARPLAPQPIAMQDQTQNPKTTKSEPDPSRLAQTDDVATQPGKPVRTTVLNAKVEGIDKTRLFPLAEAQDYKVTKLHGKFYVIDPDTNTPINSDGAARSEVNGIIERASKVGV